jgi:hypothetical protein
LQSSKISLLIGRWYPGVSKIDSGSTKGALKAELYEDNKKKVWFKK